MKVLVKSYDEEFNEFTCITKSGKGVEVKVNPDHIREDERDGIIGKVFKLKGSCYYYLNRGFNIYLPKTVEFYELTGKSSVPDVIDAVFKEIDKGVA